MCEKQERDSKDVIVLGIDPGTRITGYGIVRQRAGIHELIDYGCIRLPPDHKLSQRSLILFESIDHLLEKYKPHALSVETQYVYKNVQSAMKLGIARGMAILASTRRGIPVFEYSPSKAKLAVVGNGRASKQQVQGMMQKLLNLRELPEPEDAADALALAVCHLHSIHYRLLGGLEV